MELDLTTLGPAGDEVANEIALLVVTAESLTITSQPQYEAANALFQQVAKLRKRVGDARLERTRPLDAAKKSLMELFTPLTEQLDAGSLVLRTAIGNYEAEREAERILEQRRLQQAAEAAAEQERQRLLAEAAAVQSEAAQAVTPEDDDEDERYAAWSHAERLREEAEKVTAATVVTEAHYAPVAGTGHRTYWKFRVTDPDMLPRQFLMPDEAAIRREVNRLKEATNIPGVTVYDDSIIYATGR